MMIATPYVAVTPTVQEMLAIAPELFLLCATCGLLLIDLFVSDARRAITHYLALVVLAVTAVLCWHGGVLNGVVATSAFNGMFLRDAAADILKLGLLVVTAASLLYARPYLADRGILKGEFYLLCLFALLGSMLLVSAGNLVTVYLGLELLALSSYALVGIDRDSSIGSEAAMKYFVLGSLASGMLLYGMSMIYGGTGGQLDLAGIYASAAAQGDHQLLVLGVVFVIVGVAFKFGAAPFHMWLPDVYQGAPTAVTLFIGSVPKLASFGMAYRLLESGVGPLDGQWGPMLAWIAVLSLAIGNLLALVQTSFKRMLAYSTIAQVGFLFLGLAAADATGYAAAMFYAVSYAISATAAFGAIILLSRKGFEAENIDDFKGLGTRSPWHAWMILIVMASLAGVPPSIGFFAKLVVLDAALQSGMTWLAVVAVIFAVIGAYYYLRVIKVMFFDEPAADLAPAVHPDRSLRLVFSGNALLLLALGVAADPLASWCRLAFESVR